MSNSTTNVIFKDEYLIFEYSKYVSTICSIFLILNWTCLFILSCIWSCCLIYQLINDYRILKNGKKSKNTMDQKDFHKMLKDASIRRVKKILFLAICLSECGFIISLTVSAEETI